MRTDLDICKSMLRRALESKAIRLQQLADELKALEREIDRTPDLGRRSFSRIAGSAIHAVAWGVANLHLDDLVSAAKDCDEYLAKEQQSGELAAQRDVERRLDAVSRLIFGKAGYHTLTVKQISRALAGEAEEETDDTD